MAPATVSDGSLPTLLSSLTAALDSASSALPESVLPPENGISLLDVKNELFLSYLQNLVFLILIKIRNQKSNRTGDGQGSELSQEVVKKLVELRVYLEKGVRPLEGRLKYQIDKVVRAADDAASPSTTQKPSRAPRQEPNASESGNSEVDSEDEGEDASDLESEEMDELAYRPNPSAFARPPTVKENNSSAAGASDGVYRPPKITATAMPETRGREDRGSRQAVKSATIDEFLAEELSSAPRVESAFGPAIAHGGRRTVSQRERADQAERTAYEEANFVRLPAMSKKERAKKGYDKRGGYGGEDWRQLGEGLDRIDRLTKGKSSKSDVLARSKRRLATEDGPRGGDVEMGRGFEKKRKRSKRG